MKVDAKVTVYEVALFYDMYDDGSSIETEIFSSSCKAYGFALDKCKEFAEQRGIRATPHDWGDDNECTQFHNPEWGNTVMIEDNNTNRLFVRLKSFTL